jgi:hypothetical protein
MTYDDYGKMKTSAGSRRRRNCYKKTDYLTELLKGVNGYNMADVPPDVKSMLDRGTSHKKEVKVSDVRSLLKRNGLQAFYSRAAFLTCELNVKRGKSRPAPLDHHQEAQLRSLFNRFSFVFSRDRKGRKNSLNYSYVIFQLLGFIGREDLRPNVKLIKCKKRLRFHDSVWEGICREASWGFMPVCR